jgi:hypothetical protein
MPVVDLNRPRRWALRIISTLVAVASAASFAESYRALYVWALHHDLRGLWAVAWPVQVDAFIAVGELALFVGLADRWSPRARVFPWSVTLLGLAASVAGNVGHVTTQSLAARGTAAVPPLAASAALAVGLGVLKRVVGSHGDTTSTPPVPEPRPVPVPVLVVGELPVPRRRPLLPVPPVREEPGDKAGSSRRTWEDICDQAERIFVPALEERKIPGHREVRARLGVGHERADQVRQHLSSLLTGDAGRGQVPGTGRR